MKQLNSSSKTEIIIKQILDYMTSQKPHDDGLGERTTDDSSSLHQMSSTFLQEFDVWYSTLNEIVIIWICNRIKLWQKTDVVCSLVFSTINFCEATEVSYSKSETSVKQTFDYYMDSRKTSDGGSNDHKKHMKTF